jgi:RHS repeat-associated protein
MTVTEEAREANGSLAGKSVKYLNGLGLVRKTEALGANNVWDIVETKYTKYAEEWKQSRPYRMGDVPQWTERVYDLQRRVTQIIEPDGSVSKAFYNETARPDAASNLPGNTIRTSDAWGRERWGRYDQQGRLAEVVEPNPNGNGTVLAAGSLVTKYTQDTIGRLTKTEQGSQIREFKYDSLGRLTRQKLAEQTATLNDAGVYVGAGTWSEAFWYDTRSNLTQKTDARGVKTNYSYQISGADDPLNRLQGRSYDLSGPLAPNLPILSAPPVNYQYMTTGDKTRISRISTISLLTEDFSYDGEGRVSDYSQTIDFRSSYPMTVSYLYDSLDRVTDVRYPAQYGIAGSPRKLINHTYDTASRLTSLKIDNTEVAGNIAYNAADQTTSIKIGAAGANQVTENYTFDQQTGLLTNQKVQKSGQTLLDLSYDYNRNNSVGNLNGKTGHLTRIINNLDNNKNREYEFDALGRLTKAKGGVSNLWQQDYSYDRYGNRTNVTASGVAADNTPIPRDGIPNLTYNTTNNRITTAGFEYDVAGNQTRAQAEDGTWLRYDYDAANRLQVVKKDDGTYLQAFQFGSTNARLMSHDYETNQATMIASVGGTTLAEYIEFTPLVMTWTKSYTYFGDSILSTISKAGSSELTEFNHPDRLGTRVITNQALGTSYEQNSLPFGTALNAESTVSLSKRFTSYERSAQTGLDYAVNRTYDSKLGRFTQVDPIGMSAVSLTAPQTLNLYTYCGNDPINHTDPSGLFWGFLKKLFKWVLIAIAVIVAVITIVGVVAAPTIAGIFSAISAGASAASQVLSALGYRKAGLIFGIIAVVAGFGSVIAGKIGNSFASGDSGNNPSWSGVLSGVGAVANSLAQTKDNKRRKRKRAETSQVQIITDNAVLGALARLKGDCKKYIEGNSGLNAKDVLEKIRKRREVTHDEKSAGGNTASTINGKIYLGDSFFLDSVGGYSSGPRDAARARQVTILHELRHIVTGINHPMDANGNIISNVPESPEDFNATISRKCF